MPLSTIISQMQTRDEPSKTSVTSVPSGEGIELGPRMMVVPADQTVATPSLYRRYIKASRSCRAGEPVVAIIRTEMLNTPDRVAVTASRHSGARFAVDIEIRRYDGPLAANDPWVALILVDLDSLEPGTYQLVAQETVLRFTELHQPDRATGPTMTEQHMTFTCV